MRAAFDIPFMQATVVEGILKKLATLNRPFKYVGKSHLNRRSIALAVNLQYKRGSSPLYE